jgi:hypothetical protein
VTFSLASLDKVDIKINFNSKWKKDNLLQGMKPNWMIVNMLTLMIAQNMKVQELFANQESRKNPLETDFNLLELTQNFQHALLRPF